MTPNRNTERSTPRESFEPDRRDFGKAALAGVLAAPAMLGATTVAGAEGRPSAAKRSSNVKLAIQMNHICGDPTEPTDQEFPQ